jgi:hypothetical protein
MERKAEKRLLLKVGWWVALTLKPIEACIS